MSSALNLKGEFILCSKVRGRHYREEDHKIIYFYSTKTKNNKWICKRMYKIPEGIEFISITKYDKLCVSSNNYVYELVIHTKKSRKIFNNDEIINVAYYNLPLSNPIVRGPDVSVVLTTRSNGQDKTFPLVAPNFIA
ncbi:hypothetical protein C1645_810604 [Glomus cerebriforme]|uniref:Uncharacterized protein n=1 Tax=Glomus cerebriforme TaxID=658196 RepID=A0A397SBC1_9GLOM|nr:hypothetical protein C1645_810604 [Glomus cerebriforme]